MSENKDSMIEEVNASLREYLKKGYHVPGATTITERPEFMRPCIREVWIETKIPGGKTSNDDIYWVGGGKYAFGRGGIAKFRDAGRIELKVIGTDTQRGRDVARYVAKISGERYDLDGSPKRIEDVKIYDLIIREEEMRIKYTEKVEEDHKTWLAEQKRDYVEKSVKKVMLEKHKFAMECAITGAQARVVQKLLGLKPAYAMEELKKPFIIISVTPVVDMKDPDIKKMVTAHMLGIRETLYLTGRGVPDSVSGGGAAMTYQGEAGNEPGSICGPSASAHDDFGEFPRKVKVQMLKRMLVEKKLTVPPLEKMNESQLVALHNDLLAA